MSDAFDDLGARPQRIAPETAAPNTARFHWVASWVGADRSYSGFNRDDLIGAIKHCGLDKHRAARWASKNIGWVEGYEVAHGKPYVIPPPNEVREDWRTIPMCYLTKAERALCVSLNAELRTAKRMPK